MNEFVFSEFARRLNNIVRFGTVAEIDHEKARIRVKIGKITTTWIPWTTTAGAVKIWNPPVVGEQVTVVSQGGDLSLAVAIPSIFQSKFSAPSSDGNIVKLELSESTNIEFDRKNEEFKVVIDELEITANSKKFKVSIGFSEFEITSEKIKILSPIVEIPGLL
jgi:phage baseplate assembly protein V